MKTCITSRTNDVRTRVMLLLVALLMAPIPVHAEPESARQVVESTVAQVLAVLQTPDLTLDQRRTRIEKIVYVEFDFQTMSRLVLARNWKKFDAAQREAFIREFKRHLSRSYGTRLARYEQEQVEVTGERTEKRGDVTVLTVIRGGQFDGAEINYRMRDREDSWRVIDVIIEGVSLVSNFRSQFKDVVSREGPAGLIEQLKTKNDAEGSGE